MTQTPPDAIFIDQPTDGQRILQALTQPAPTTSGHVPKTPPTASQQPAFRQTQPVPIAPAPAQPPMVIVNYLIY